MRGLLQRSFDDETLERAATGFALAMRTLVEPSYPFTTRPDPGTVRMTARLANVIGVEE